MVDLGVTHGDKQIAATPTGANCGCFDFDECNDGEAHLPTPLPWHYSEHGSDSYVYINEKRHLA